MAPNIVLLQKMASNVCRKTNEHLCLEATPKKVFMIVARANL